MKNIVYEARKSVLFEKVLITSRYNPIGKGRKQKRDINKKNYSNVKALSVDKYSSEVI